MTGYLPAWLGLAACVFGAQAAVQAPSPPPAFSDTERAAVQAYWSAPGRYSVTAPPTAAQTGPWVVRLTPEASRWFLSYQIAVGQAKAPPTQDAAAATPATEAWEQWVQAKLAYDRALARARADAANSAIGIAPPPPLAPPTAGAVGSGSATQAPAASSIPPAGAPPPGLDTTASQNGAPGQPAQTAAPVPQGLAPRATPPPGPIPADLLAAVGDPPPFADAVAPLQYTITFDDGNAYTFQDHVPVRPRFAYYRFQQGVMSIGKMLRDMTDTEMAPLFAAAGMTPSEARIMSAVSRQEGGFDAINTYDTGFVSVGFLQFVTMGTGRNSLTDVLAREKAERAADYQQDFRRFGIDIDGTGTLDVVDPGTGAELTGPAAVSRVIDDKRLTAVFQRAGRSSTAFRVAQIEVAKARYWPTGDPFTVTINGTPVSGKVSDLIRSEAGIATLFDRKVNRGSIGPFSDTVAKVIAEHNLQSLQEVGPYEREIVTMLKYRADYLKYPSLSQPPLLPVSGTAPPDGLQQP